MGRSTASILTTPLAIRPTLPMPQAAVYIGKHYESLRDLVKAGVFTKVVFSAATKRPPVSLYVHELDAWKAGGVEGVRAVRPAGKAQRRKPSKAGV